MKKWTKKVWMSAAAVGIAIMSVSAIPASADVSRVVYFTVQNNTVCDSTNYITNFRFNVNNISSTAADVSVHFFNDNGLEVTPTGTSMAGFTTTFSPGSIVSLGANSTVHYAAQFGAGTNACGDRPAYGKIVVESGSGWFLANGEIRDQHKSAVEVYSDVPIIINNGQPF